MLHAVEGASDNEATREAISLAPAFRQVISSTDKVLPFHWFPRRKPVKRPLHRLWQSPTGLKAGANEMVVQLFKEE